MVNIKIPTSFAATRAADEFNNISSSSVRLIINCGLRSMFRVELASYAPRSAQDLEIGDHQRRFCLSAFSAPPLTDQVGSTFANADLLK
jgi:hypothetical protein